MKMSLFVGTAIVSTFAAALLTACGDENTTIVNENTGIQMLGKGEKLPACTEENVGEMMYVTDSSAVFFCADEKWQTLKGEDGKDGKDSSLKDTVVLNKIDTVVVSKIDTIVVLDTQIGLNGTNCGVEAIENGFKIVCGGDSVGVVFNGSDGNVGEKGEKGQDACSLADNGDGIVTVSCGSGENLKVTELYTALCKGAPYNPKKKECLDLGLISLCSEETTGIVEENTNGSVYTCRDGLWNLATDEEVVVGKACLDSLLGEFADGSDGNKWTCRSMGWDKSTELELAIGKTCTSINQNESESLDYSNWICRADSIGWVYDFANINYGSVVHGGKAYATVGIGSQMWFAENLNYVTSGGNADDRVASWCHGYTETNCAVYGRLYTWAAAMDLPSTYLTESAEGLIQEKHKGLCPNGWHIPSRSEFRILEEFVDKYNGSEGVGTSLKAAKLWRDTSTTVKGSDKFGFAMLPSGYGHIPGSTAKDGNLNIDGEIWMSTEVSTNKAHGLYISYKYNLKTATVGKNGLDYTYEIDGNVKNIPRSIRCIKD